MIRKLIPSGIKRQIRITQRHLSDRKAGFNQIAARKSDTSQNTQLIHTIEQPIFYNPLSSNKVFNIRLAVKEIEEILIRPGEVFSFWKIVGKPTANKGYKTGRNIIGDSLQEDIGGGLCQVSGMIYHLALTTGMQITARYNHTLDLYEEDKRYTPLGADATVVYGYKDLRFKNTTSTPVSFKFEVFQNQFKGKLYAAGHLPVFTLEFRREEFEDHRTIKTYRSLNNEEEFINLSRYLL